MRIDPQDLAVQVRRVLRVRAVGGIPHRRVQKTVPAELQLSAVVVAGARPPDHRRDSAAAGDIGDVAIRADAELVDVDVAKRRSGASAVSEEDVEEPIGGVVRVERHRK
jgi:hypothetical protein